MSTYTKKPLSRFLEREAPPIIPYETVYATEINFGLV
jgi:hypothetical protein